MRPPAFLVAALTCLAQSLPAQEPRLAAVSSNPPQAELKDLNGYFPFKPAGSSESWQKRADSLRLQTKIALGIFPEPTRTPLNAVIHGRIEHPDYTVEKVYFESMPGFFVSGSLFRPKGKTGPHPAVLCPHGHWPDGRFQRRDDAEMKKELDAGGERFLESGRSVFQSLGVQLARMGCVAFVIDMLGYADSQQISFEIAHKFATQRPEMNTAENWGLYSPQAEAHLQSVLGLQTWNNIRALDFLTGLPDVDAKRIGCTGASGGGTQTFLLGAVDSRVTVAAPAVMVGTAMQGGCTCENACLLRIDTGNVEFAALFAPKPQVLISANDWTKEVETKGFPELKAHYAMLGAPDQVAHWPLLQFGHNYNQVSREKIYAWFNRSFALGLTDEQLREREYTPLTREQLTVWDAAHPAPVGGPEFERKLLRWWTEDSQAQLAKSPEQFSSVASSVIDQAWKALIRYDSPSRGISSSPGFVLDFQKTAPPVDRITYVETKGELKGPHNISVTLLQPKKSSSRKVLWLDERGQSGLFLADGQPRSQVRRLLDAGLQVIGADLELQGELPSGQKHPEQNPIVKNPRESAAYTYGYNQPVFAKRVRQAIALSHWLDGMDDGILRGQGEPFHPAESRVSIVALDTIGPVGAVAARFAANTAVIETAGFRFGHLKDWRSLNFLPGAAKYGDLPGILAQAFPRKLYLLGERSDSAPLLQQAYQPNESGAELVIAPPLTDPSEGIDWLLNVLANK